MIGLLVKISLMKERLEEIYARLFARFGAQHWWPAQTNFEIVVGAILTQNTAWVNVEYALANLKRHRLLNPRAMHRASPARLTQLIRPSGYFNLKAKRLKAFTNFLFEHHRGRLAHLFDLESAQLRAQLLGVYGIGPETADSIILYAGRKPIFVVDAYTRRIFARLGLTKDTATYSELQSMFMNHLSADAQRFNEYHALIVALGKTICRKNAPACAGCPLLDICPTGRIAG